MGKKPVLGKGISALIPEYAEPSGQGDATRQVVYLNVDEVEPNPYQARTTFDEEQIDELMRSIKKKASSSPSPSTASARITKSSPASAAGGPPRRRGFKKYLRSSTKSSLNKT